MRVACLRENLIRGLGASGGAIPSRTAMDILQNVPIDPWETRLKISGTNLETTITPWTETQGAYSRERRPVCAHRAGAALLPGAAPNTQRTGPRRVRPLGAGSPARSLQSACPTAAPDASGQSSWPQVPRVRFLIHCG